MNIPSAPKKYTGPLNTHSKLYYRERQREKEREGETARERERQKERDKETERERETERDRERKKERLLVFVLLNVVCQLRPHSLSLLSDSPSTTTTFFTDRLFQGLLPAPLWAVMLFKY